MEYANNNWRYKDWRFGVGDSVINITNKYVEVEAQTVLQVANGEIGIVVSAGGGRVAVRFDSVVWFDILTDNSLRPAYALTVNKAQGSEYPIVIVKASSTWGSKRERFYTAITRAQQKCIVYEVGNSIDECIRAKPSLRKTYLMQRMWIVFVWLCTYFYLKNGLERVPSRKKLTFRHSYVPIFSIK